MHRKKVIFDTIQGEAFFYFIFFQFKCIFSSWRSRLVLPLLWLFSGIFVLSQYLRSGQVNFQHFPSNLNLTCWEESCDCAVVDGCKLCQLSCPYGWLEFPGVNWECYTSDTNRSREFLKCVEDDFLVQVLRGLIRCCVPIDTLDVSSEFSGDWWLSLLPFSSWV